MILSSDYLPGLNGIYKYQDLEAAGSAESWPDHNLYLDFTSRLIF